MKHPSWNLVLWSCAALLTLSSGCADTSSAGPAESIQDVSRSDGQAVSAAGQLAVGRGAHPPVSTRSVVVLWDLTESFKPTPEALEQVFTGLVSALGPGDDLLVATIGAPDFSPRDDVRVQCRMPAVPASVLAGSATTRDWRMKRARLAATWAQVDARAQALARLLAQPAEHPKTDGTDVHGAIKYAAHRLATGSATERYLILLSDLLHEEGGRKTDMPVDETLNLDGVRVTAAGVPWDDSRWAERETAWRRFVERSGGLSFSMFDQSKMLEAAFLPATGVPRDLKPPVPMDLER